MIVLTARYGRPVPIALGILVARLLNHAVATSGGYLVSQWLSGRTFHLLVGAAFIAMAGWALTRIAIHLRYAVAALDRRKLDFRW